MRSKPSGGGDVCRCTRALSDGTCPACLCSFFCTACMYHRLNSGTLEDHQVPVPCTGGCCKDLLCFTWVPCVAGGVAAALYQVPVAYQIASALGAAAGRLWEAYVSKEALKRSASATAVDYDYASFLFCLPCTYYNVIIDDSVYTQREFSHRNPIMAPLPLKMAL